MKIKDGLNLPGWRVEIPDCGRDDLPEFFRDMGFKVGVEVGVRHGVFSKVLCEGGMKVFGVDPFYSYNDCPWYERKGRTHDAAYKIAKNTLAPYDYTLIRKMSIDALSDFENGSIDFVYIDGNHAFKYVTEDIWGWSKKVKKGGVISGHDYAFFRARPGYCDVRYVIDAYTRCLRLSKWYILGCGNDAKRDRFRSWFWFNP